MIRGHCYRCHLCRYTAEWWAWADGRRASTATALPAGPAAAPAAADEHHLRRVRHAGVTTVVCRAASAAGTSAANFVTLYAGVHVAGRHRHTSAATTTIGATAEPSWYATAADATATRTR